MAKRYSFLIVLLVTIVLAAAAAGIFGWQGMGEVEISGHGIFALILGTVFSLAMGGGLMFLVFFSSRRGHDDEAGTSD